MINVLLGVAGGFIASLLIAVGVGVILARFGAKAIDYDYGEF
jgi:hypothetical protein